MSKDIFDQLGNVFVEQDAPTERIPFGILPLDIITGGGMPVGRVAEVYGWESTGKTTLVLQHCANVQKHGGIVIYCDAEFAIDGAYEERLGKLGLSTEKDKLRVGHPDTVEEMFEAIRKSAVHLRKSSKGPVVYVIDSVAAAPPRAELEGTAQLGLQAKVFNTELRKSIGLISKNEITLICINHRRDKFGIAYGDKTTTPGGQALKFYSSLRLQISMLGKLKGKNVNAFGFKYNPDDAVGFLVEIRTIKNKTTSPLRNAHCAFLYDVGFHDEVSTFETMRHLDICRSKDKRWVFKNVGECSKGDVVQFIRDNKEALSNEMQKRYFEYVGSNAPFLDEEEESE